MAKTNAMGDGLVRESEKKRSAERRAPACAVVPLPSIGGERRTYRGVAQSFASHAHGHYVFGCVREGERTLQLNDLEHRIKAGDMLVFNPGDVHGCQQAGEELFAYDSIIASADLFDDASLRFSAGSSAQVRAAFGALMAARDGEEMLERTLLLASLLEVERENRANSLVASTSRAHEEAALRTYAHLRGHLAEPVSVAQLAAREGLSEYALIRAYRRRFAITPLQHLMSLRVECACDLLARGANPATVAAETGFADQAHLTRVFKQRIGTTPAAYGKMAAR